MIKIGITGSLASGKTTASQILSYRRGPLFSADKIVKKLYKDENFKRLLSKKFNIKNDNFIKKNLKKIIFANKKNILKLEKIIHPQVRINMKKFTQLNESKEEFDPKELEMGIKIESEHGDIYEDLLQWVDEQFIEVGMPWSKRFSPHRPLGFGYIETCWTFCTRHWPVPGHSP